jgi:hypothetical protein
MTNLISRKGWQGCQMVCFQTINPNLGNIWRALEWKMLYFMIIWNILWLHIWHNVWHFGIVFGYWIYFSPFGMFGPRKVWQSWRLGEKKPSSAETNSRKLEFSFTVSLFRWAEWGRYIGRCFISPLGANFDPRDELWPLGAKTLGFSKQSIHTWGWTKGIILPWDQSYPVGANSWLKTGLR